MTLEDIGVGLVGSGFITSFHAQAFGSVNGASVVAVASTQEDRVRAFAERWDIPRWHVGHERLLEDPAVDVVVVGAPNFTHREIVVAAAAAGKHVICEKPLARTLADADEMIAACRQAGVMLGYAEELCFAPKFARAKQLVDEGALGRLFKVQQGEQHDGPHADWFWDVDRSGGGALMDMGCHAIEFFRWMYDRAPIESVLAELGTYMHSDRTRGDDHAIATVRFAGNRVGVIETSWAKVGGLEDRVELLGTEGVAYADLLRGSSIQTFSEVGYGYAVEKAPETKGWSFTMYEELWNSGFPQEMQHFVDCVRDGTEPLHKGEDGRTVLEVIYAIYLSAGTGRRVELPLQLDAAAAAAPPIYGWRPPQAV